MHYIRFLKTPVLTYINSEQSTHSVYSLITITSDLGDSFFPEDLNLSAFILYGRHEQEKAIHYQAFQWKARMRSLQLQLHFKPHTPRRLVQLRLMIAAKDTVDTCQGYQRVSLGKLPSIISVWSEAFGFERRPLKREIERWLQLPGDIDIVIREETGESIACHIWDAGLVLATYLSGLKVLGDEVSFVLDKVLNSTSHRKLNVLELGCGCGTVGITLAQAIPNSEVLLTDLSEAEAIINTNIAAIVSAPGSKAVFEMLDWEKDVPSTIQRRRFDVIVVADCIYNPDSAPALVKTLDSLLKSSPQAVIVLATKVRHQSEAVFFDFMEAASIPQIADTRIALPTIDTSMFVDSSPRVDIYLFSRIIPDD